MKRLASALLVLLVDGTARERACGAAATRANVSAPVDDATITTRVKTAFINDPLDWSREDRRGDVQGCGDAVRAR